MPPSERKARERKQRRERIIVTARQVAEAEGWSAVTTRRLATEIDYSQPVLYSHFRDMEAIRAAVAEVGFGELAEELASARRRGRTPTSALGRVARAYLAFADANPALYDAMFTMRSDLQFASADTPPKLQAGFGELRAALEPVVGSHQIGLRTETFWATLHGLVTLTRAGRLPVSAQEARLRLLLAQLAA